MSALQLWKINPETIPAPGPGSVMLFVDQEGVLSHKTDTGAVVASLPVGTGSAGAAGVVAVDQYFENVALLLNMQGVVGAAAFVDLSPRAKNVVAVGAGVKMSDLACADGVTSCSFSGAASYLRVPYSPDFDVAGGNFTVEGWIYLDNLAGNKTLFARGLDATMGVFLAGGVPMMFASSNGSGWNLLSGDSGPTNGAGTKPVQVQRWTHWVMQRAGDVWTLYIDGQVSKRSTVAGSVIARGDDLFVGRWGANAGSTLYEFAGHMQNFRYTKGVARYPGAFVPGAAHFPLGA